jgi:hypothetical protein
MSKDPCRQIFAISERNTSQARRMNCIKVNTKKNLTEK